MRSSESRRRSITKNSLSISDTTPWPCGRAQGWRSAGKWMVQHPTQISLPLIRRRIAGPRLSAKNLLLDRPVDAKAQSMKARGRTLVQLQQTMCATDPQRAQCGRIPSTEGLKDSLLTLRASPHSINQAQKASLHWRRHPVGVCSPHRKSNALPMRRRPHFTIAETVLPRRGSWTAVHHSPTATRSLRCSWMPMAAPRLIRRPLDPNRYTTPQM
mmetsp:Transcript_2227/g.4102  ORF Transcript_2227/g.4102 Transcript_2227/m.4102 type:complete len:214 (-) Transcript_2227:2006-2647(-)